LYYKEAIANAIQVHAKPYNTWYCSVHKEFEYEYPYR